MSEAETLPESFRLSEPDRRVLTAGIVLLFICTILHAAAFVVRIYHNHSGHRKLWLVRLVKRPHGGSFIIFSPGFSCITFGGVICLAKGLHGSLKLESEIKNLPLSSTEACGYLGLFMATFTFECLVSWFVWSSILVQAAQSYESFMAQTPQHASKQLWLLREGRWWNLWLLGCPTIILPIMVAWITTAMLSYRSAVHAQDLMEAADSETAQYFLLQVAHYTKQVLRRCDQWIITMISWVSVTLVTYGFASIRLLVVFKKEEFFVSRLKSSASVKKPSYHDKHLALQGYQPNMSLVSARHSALSKKTRQLILINIWILGAWVYIMFCGIWFASLSLEKKATPRISEKSSLVADKFLLGLLDLPMAVYLLWSSLRYDRKAPRKLCKKIHPLEYVYPKETEIHERNLIWGLDEQRATRTIAPSNQAVTELNALSKDSNSVVSDKESV